MVFGTLLAGSVGSRINIENMPKQFLSLNDKPIFVHTLQKFLLCPKVDAIYLGAHKDWLGFVKDIIKEFDLDKQATPIRICCIGECNDLAMHIIDAIEFEYGESNDHIIVAHDSVYPFIKLLTIEKNIAAMENYDACDAASPATDTIMCSEKGSYIDFIPVRSAICQTQAPQTFRTSVLKKLYSQMSTEQGHVLTDACKIFIELNKLIALVQSAETNIKLTTIADDKIIRAMVSDGSE